MRKIMPEKVYMTDIRPRYRLLFSLLIAGLLYTLPNHVNAHHAPFLYDSFNLITLKGEFVELRHINPHSKLSLKIITHDGKQELWTVGLPSPGGLKRQGNEDALMNLLPGEKLIVQGWPHKVNNNEIRSHQIIFPDGKMIQTVKNNFFRPKTIIALDKLFNDPENIIEPGFDPAIPVPDQLIQWIKEDRYIKRLAMELHANRSFFIGLSEHDSISFIGIKDHLSCLPDKHPVYILNVTDHPWLNETSSRDYISAYNQLLARHLERTLLTCGD